MRPLLWKSSLRYFLRHPWQSGLSILAVALGVGVVVSIDLTNESAKRSFEHSIESLGGRATHQVVPVSGDLSESVYTRLRLDLNIRQIAPVVEGSLSLPDFPGKTIRVLGIDPFVEKPFRRYLTSWQLDFENLKRFISQTRSMILSKRTAESLNLQPADTLRVRQGRESYDLELLSILQTPDDLEDEVLEDLLITDISTAQEILNKVGTLSQINLILPQGPQRILIEEQLRQILPYGIRLRESSKRLEGAEKLTRSFHLNLSVFSLLTLIVGVFLIYNTMTFSVAQRFPILGRLRALGMNRGELFLLLLSEAFLIGSAGTLIGLGLGIFLAQGLIELVTQTINDFYYNVSVNQIQLSVFVFSKAIILGVVASLVAALLPAREAAQIEPGLIIRRSNQEDSTRILLPRLTMIAVALLIVSGILIWFPSRELIPILIAVFFMILGISLLVPGITKWLVRLVLPLMYALFKTPGLLATRGITAELSRTSIAITALLVAISTSVGVGIMVESFRFAVVHWLDSSLQADVYLSANAMNNQDNSVFLPEPFIEKVSGIPGVAHVGTLRQLNVQIDMGPHVTDKNLPWMETLHLVALDIPLPGRSSFQFKQRESSSVWESFEKEDTIFISEPLAYRLQLRPGMTIVLKTPHALRPFRILGIFYDYGREQGYAAISRNIFRKHWQDKRIHSMALYLEPSRSKISLISQIRQMSVDQQPLLVQSNETLRDYSIKIFDRTFAITRILRILIMGVAFLGVLSALMALELEKQREFAVLRIVGLTPWQLWGVVVGQCGLMGIFAGLLAVPLGYMLAQILIHVINLRSFGWTFQTILPAEICAQGFVLGLTAALLAGIYPAFKMARIIPAKALREDSHSID